VTTETITETISQLELKLKLFDYWN